MERLRSARVTKFDIPLIKQPLSNYSFIIIYNISISMLSSHESNHFSV
jgi:hypothetical protein